MIPRLGDSPPARASRPVSASQNLYCRPGPRHERQSSTSDGKPWKVGHEQADGPRARRDLLHGTNRADRPGVCDVARRRSLLRCVLATATALLAGPTSVPAASIADQLHRFIDTNGFPTASDFPETIT